MSLVHSCFAHMQYCNTCSNPVTSLYFFQSQPFSTPRLSCPSLSHSVPCSVTPNRGSQSFTACLVSDTNVLHQSRLDFPWGETFLEDRNRGGGPQECDISSGITFFLLWVCCYQLSWIHSLELAERSPEHCTLTSWLLCNGRATRIKMSDMLM